MFSIASQGESASLGAGAAISLYEVFFFLNREVGPFTRIDARGDDIEFLADVKVHHAE